MFYFALFSVHLPHISFVLLFMYFLSNVSLRDSIWTLTNDSLHWRFYSTFNTTNSRPKVVHLRDSYQFNKYTDTGHEIIATIFLFLF